MATRIRVTDFVSRADEEEQTLSREIADVQAEQAELLARDRRVSAPVYLEKTLARGPFTRAQALALRERLDREPQRFPKTARAVPQWVARFEAGHYRGLATMFRSLHLPGIGADEINAELGSHGDAFLAFSVAVMIAAEEHPDAFGSLKDGGELEAWDDRLAKVNEHLAQLNREHAWLRAVLVLPETAAVRGGASPPAESTELLSLRRKGMAPRLIGGNR